MFAILFATAMAYAQISVQPASYNFGQVQVGFRASTSVTVYNQTDKKIGSLYAQNTCPSAIDISSGCSGGLPPHGACYISVYFTPPFDNYYSCSINIRSDAGSSSVYLSGTGYKN